MIGSLVWIKSPEVASQEVAFLKGEIVRVDGANVEVKLVTGAEGAKPGEVRRVLASETRPRFARTGTATAADNTALVHMNDASILENLEVRHKQDEIYTYTASVLLAVNPYKIIKGLYGDSQCSKYRGKHIGALAPHPYAIADTAYRLLVREKVNQALLISGESGAGKTETAKIVMEYLAFASGTTSDLAKQIQARVLQAQPILESFGNAATLRNSNSSRFGKYNRVYFDNEGTLVDAGIQTYLLESSRVVVHGKGERSYHVFYEMLQGLPDEKLQAFHLDRTKLYRLLNSSSRVPGFEDRDKKNFDRLCVALETVGMDKERIDGCLQVLAGLVHLGDIPQDDAEADMAARAANDEDTTRCVEVNDESVIYAAEALGMDPDELQSTLQMKTLKIPGRESMHKVARSPMQFRQALHSLIRALYKRLFEQTVRSINDSFQELRPQQVDGEDTWKNIGILDIYGFERLQRNSFEQLCINLANERLQQYFVENVLVAEQHLYTREGLPWTGLALPNSEPVVSCISYVFKTLDDFSSRLAKGFGEQQQVSDDKFCEKVIKESTLDPQRKEVLKAPKLSAKNARNSTGPRTNEVFIISHYAGTVDYNTQGWLDKNNDRLLLECEELIVDSVVPFVKAMGDEDGKQPFRSISSKYCKDLEALLQTLSEANLHYIRCFKPNGSQKPDLFNGPLVLDQIIQCGTIELVKIMHDGFPNRCVFEELYNRFKTLLPENFQRYGMRTFIEALMLAYEVPRAEWALGMSRLFLKAGQLKALEDMRAEGVAPKTENLERIVKQLIRKRWCRACEAIRLCNWLPKLLRQVYVKRAASTLTAVALVTSNIAPRLDAARQRVAQRRLRNRRRLAGAFKTVFCLGVSWRNMRERRQLRLYNAFRIYALIAARTKPWLERARECLREAEKRRQREEERRKQELEQRMKEEEERLRLEAAKRMEEEEEQRRLEVERRKQEEEARVQAEAERRRLEEDERCRAQAEQERLEEERKAEQDRQRLEQERKREEERELFEAELQKQQQALEEEKRRVAEELEATKAKFAEEMAEQKQRMAAELEQRMAEEKQRLTAEAELARQRAAEELAAQRQEQEQRLKMEMEQKRVEMEEQHQETIRRLSMAAESMAAESVGGSSTAIDTSATATQVLTPRIVGEDAETDIGDSVSVAHAGGLHPDIMACVKHEIEKQMQLRVLEQQLELQKQVVEVQKRNDDLVAVLQKRNDDLNNQPHLNDSCEREASLLDLSPLANGTPHKRQDLSPQMTPSPLHISPSSAQKNDGGNHLNSQSSKRYSLLSGLDSSGRGGLRRERQSAAQEVLMHMGMPGGISSSRLSVGPDIGGNKNQQQRKLWAEQRQFLMEDLYPMSCGGTPTPVRSKASKREDGSATRLSAAPDDTQFSRKLGPEFERAQIDSNSPTDNVSQTKMKRPGFSKKDAGCRY